MLNKLCSDPSLLETWIYRKRSKNVAKKTICMRIGYRTEGDMANNLGIRFSDE